MTSTSLAALAERIKERRRELLQCIRLLLDEGEIDGYTVKKIKTTNLTRRLSPCYTNHRSTAPNTKTRPATPKPAMSHDTPHRHKHRHKHARNTRKSPAPYT